MNISEVEDVDTETQHSLANDNSPKFTVLIDRKLDAQGQPQYVSSTIRASQIAITNVTSRLTRTGLKRELSDQATPSAALERVEHNGSDVESASAGIKRTEKETRQTILLTSVSDETERDSFHGATNQESSQLPVPSDHAPSPPKRGRLRQQKLQAAAKTDPGERKRREANDLGGVVIVCF